MIKSQRLENAEGVEHGFFTREGGFSEGLYASLNCGFGSGDDRGIVARNRLIVSDLLGVERAALMTVYQCHSADVLVVREPHDVLDAPKADAMVTDVPGMALGVLTADCAPVLFADAEAGVVGAAHAGWQGALSGVCEATVVAMEKLGASRANITASIGPSISQGAYEVGPEFRERFVGERDGLFFIPSKRAQHLMFDLTGYIAHRLAECGVHGVDALRVCTYSDPEQFFSYRRATHAREGAYGRQISAIALGE
ncbi:MAG: peptidoglycan editing factor PgeF [Aestuariivirgaceae bacterium]|nr:peptidoglycan editing factor PgeF [Aestuariivirgaceae bacterium]